MSPALLPLPWPAVAEDDLDGLSDSAVFGLSAGAGTLAAAVGAGVETADFGVLAALFLSLALLSLRRCDPDFV